MTSPTDIEAGAKVAVAPKKYLCGMTKKSIIWTSVGVTVALLVVAGVLIGVFVGGKSMAQSAVDASMISMESLHIKDQNTDDCPEDLDFCLNSNMQLEMVNTYPLDADMAGFKAYMGYNGADFAYVNMPSIMMAGSASTKLDEDLVMHVFDTENYNKFSAAMMTEKVLVSTMKADVDVTSLGLTFGVKMNKAVPLQGFNGFTDPAPVLKSIDFYEPSDEEVIEFITDVEGVEGAVFAVAVNLLPNPSIISVDNVGKISGDLMFKGKKIGTGKAINDVSIQLGNNNVLEMTTVLQKTADNVEELRELMSNYVNGLETVITLLGTGSSDPIWNEPVKAMVSQVIMAGLVADEDKQFQTVNVMTETTMGSMTAEGTVDKEYCADHVLDYEGTVGTMGRLSLNQVQLKNPFGMSMEVVDFDMMIHMHVDNATEVDGYHLEKFAWVGRRESDPNQRSFFLEPYQSKMQPMTACIYSPVLAGKNVLFATVGPATELLRDTAFKQLAEVYGDDAYFNAAQPKKNGKPASATSMAFVKSDGRNVAQLYLTMEGTQSVWQEKGKFLLDGIKIIQKFVPAMARFKGNSEKGNDEEE